MARVLIDIKDKTKEVIVAMARKRHVTIKSLILSSLGVIDA